MSENKNVSLGDMMDRAPRTSTIDLTVKPTKPAESAIPTPVSLDNMERVDVASILPKKEEVSDAGDELFAELDAAVDKECQSITERMEAIREAQADEIDRRDEEAYLADVDSGDKTSTSTSTNDDEDFGLYDDKDVEIPAVKTSVTRAAIRVPQKEESTTTATEESAAVVTNNVDDEKAEIESERASILANTKDFDLFGDDDEDDTDSTIDDGSNERRIEELKAEVKEKIQPIKKAYDLSKFSISKKAVSISKVMKMATQGNVNVADWVLYGAKRPFSATALSGPEILKLNPDNTNRNRLNTFRDMYRVIYDHILDANKPDFEVWLKQTRFIDMAHIYFGLYKATFGGSNFVNYSCPNCGKIFLRDVSFEDMIVYADDKVKKEVQDMLKMDTTSASNDSYEVDLVQVSNDYVFALRTPSIWNVIIETASLNDQFLEKHQDLIDVVAFIDTIYVIDEANETLIPIDTKPDPNDQAKTSARRVKAFYDVIRTLSSEDFYLLRSKINGYDNDSSAISYRIPATTCPECATAIPENTEMTPDGMLFTRHQLAAIGSM